MHTILSGLFVICDVLTPSSFPSLPDPTAVLTPFRRLRLHSSLASTLSLIPLSTVPTPLTRSGCDCRLPSVVRTARIRVWMCFPDIHLASPPPLPHSAASLIPPIQGCHRRPALHLFVSGCASPDTWPSNDHPGKRYTPWAVPKDSARHLGLAPSSTQQHPGRGSSSSGAAAGSDLGGVRRLKGLQGGGEKGEEEGEEEEEEELFYYAHELPDNKLVGLLAACARTPKSWRKEAEAMQVS